MIALHAGDCRQLLPYLPPHSIGSCVADPPYEIGFMRRKWDATGVAFDPAVWSAVQRALVPGGFVLVFAGKYGHRLAMVLDELGYEAFHPIIWLRGGGWPKAGLLTEGPGKRLPPEARKLLEGLGGRLKPAAEIIYVFRAPLTGSLRANALEYGAGAFRIDDCRIAVEVGDEVTTHSQGGSVERAGVYGDIAGYAGDRKAPGQELGRWPANVVWTHAADCTATVCGPTCPGRNIDAASGEAGQLLPLRGDEPSSALSGTVYGDNLARRPATPRADTGGAARFYYGTRATNTERWGWCHTCGDVTPRTKQAKRRHRGHDVVWHPTVKPVNLLRYLLRLVTPRGARVLDPFGGTGTTGIAAAAEGHPAVLAEENPIYARIIRGRCRALEIECS